MAQTLLIIPSFPAPLFQSNDSKRVTTETKPSMSIRRDPLDLLKKEHEEGQKHLERLGSAADSIKINGFSVEAFEEIVDAVRWMNTDVRRHTDWEEKHLFPLIERHTSELPEQMRNDHRELRSSFTQLLDIVREIEEGKMRGSSIHEIVQISYVIVELMRSHIQKENDHLFPLAQKMLTIKEYDELMHQVVASRS